METRIIKETFADGSTGIYIQQKQLVRNYAAVSDVEYDTKWEYLDQWFRPTPMHRERFSYNTIVDAKAAQSKIVDPKVEVIE